MKKFLVSLLIILFASMAWAIPPAPIPPIRAIDCSPFIADGVMCYDTDNDKLYIGNGTAAIEQISTSYIFPNAGVPVYDSNSTHSLYLKTDSNLTANHNLTFTTGDSDRTITLSGDPTLADWFDQAVKAASAVTFGTVDTGQGANELYDMDQNVLTSSTPQFAGLTLSTDAILSRKGAANFQFGAADAAAPVAQSLSVQSVVAGTVDTAGANFTIKGSQGTGTGAGGSIVFQTSPAAAGTGNTQNAPVTALTIGPTGRHTITTTNDYGLVFGSLGTATRGIDLSGSGLSGATDYWIYNSSTNYWDANGRVVALGVGLGSSPDSNRIYNVSVGSWQFLTTDALLLAVGIGDKSAVITGDATSFTNVYTSITFPTANKDYMNLAGIGTAHAVGELVHIYSGTGVTPGIFRVKTILSANSIQVDRNIHASGTDITDGRCLSYKNVISFGQTDGTNGQMLTSWSAQNKPLQLGGTVLAATATLTSADIVIGANIGLSQTQAASNQAGTLATVHTAGNPGIYFKVIDPATGVAYAVPGWAIP